MLGERCWWVCGLGGGWRRSCGEKDFKVHPHITNSKAIWYSNKENRFVLATKDQERSRVFLTTLAELVKAGFSSSEEIRMEVVNVCEIVVDEFWRAGEENTIRELRSEILQKLRWLIEAGEANSQLVGVWRRMWMLDPNSNNEKGKDYF